MNIHAKSLSILGITRRNLFRQPIRTGLCTLGVTIGIVAIVAIGSIARGLAESIQTGIRTNGSDLIIYQAGTSMDFLSILDEEKTHSALMSDPDVIDTSAGQSHFLTLDGKIGSIVITIGVNPNAYTVRGQQTIEGRMMRSDDEAVLGINLAHRAHKTVGDSIKLGDRTFTVCGITQMGNVFFDGAAMICLPTLQAMMGRQGKVTCFYARLKTGADRYRVAERLERNHPELAAIADVDQYKKIDQGLEYTRGAVWAVSFLALVVGALVVANTMWMSVSQRTREIGVLRAVGWSRRSVMGMVFLEAAGIGLLACPLGGALGVGLALFTTIVPTVNQFVDPVFSAPTFLQAFAVAMLLSVIGAAMPSIRAANISPVEALRHE